MERSRLVVAGEVGEILIPMAENICVSVDPGAGRIVVDPPAGLVELNAVTRRT
jgi:ribosomal 30S subunit maturation factor RimM